MGSGLIISEEQPELTNRYTWLKPLPNGGKEWYEPADGGWVKVREDFAPAVLEHAHTELSDVSLNGSISTDGETGISGTRTLGGYTITFKNGLLVGFEAV